MTPDTKPAPWSPPKLDVEPASPSRLQQECGDRRCEGHNILFILDTHTGRLYARRATHQETSRHEWLDGSLSLQPYGLRWATRKIAAATVHWAVKTVADVDDILAKLAHPARHLLAHLAPVPGSPGEWDWTLQAARAYSAMHSIALNPHLHQGDEDLGKHGAGYVTVDQVAERWPDWPNDEWAAMSDDELDQVAAAGLHVPYTPHEQRDEYEQYWGWSWNIPMRVVGARLGLRTWRNRAISKMCNSLPASPAEAWFAKHPPKISADTSDDELDRIAARAKAKAARCDEIALIAADRHLRQQRAILRQQVRDDLEQVAKQAEQAIAEAERLRALRAAGVLRIIAWHDPDDYDESGKLRESQLARRARMTRQGVAYLEDQAQAADNTQICYPE